MKIRRIEEMHRGWLIGDFEPSIYQTKDFEVGILTHPRGEKWPAHYHKVATEYNILLEGKMRVCDVDLSPGDIFVIEPNEIADPIFYEDCKILCVKVPSHTQDKFTV